MRALTKLTILAVMGLGLTQAAHATTAVRVQQSNATITISPGGDPSYPYSYSPAQLNAKAGQPITITNNDPNGVHSVTAKDNSFSVDIPPKGTATVTVKAPGSHPYSCTYHPGEHNEASINAS